MPGFDSIQPTEGAMSQPLKMTLFPLTGTPPDVDTCEISGTMHYDPGPPCAACGEIVEDLGTLTVTKRLDSGKSKKRKYPICPACWEKLDGSQ